MSILIELLLELFGGGIGPQSDRGLVATLGAASVALALATVWLVATSPNPFGAPPWGIWVMAGSILVGAAGVVVSLLHLRRSHADRIFSVMCLSANVASIVVAVGWWMTR